MFKKVLVGFGTMLHKPLRNQVVESTDPLQRLRLSTARPWVLLQSVPTPKLTDRLSSSQRWARPNDMAPMVVTDVETCQPGLRGMGRDAKTVARLKSFPSAPSLPFLMFLTDAP